MSRFNHATIPLTMFFCISAFIPKSARAFILVPRTQQHQQRTLSSTVSIHQRVLSSSLNAVSTNRRSQTKTTTTNKNRYSAVTLQRIEGLQAHVEFAKLVTKLNTPPEKLRTALSKQLASIPEKSNNPKAEYIDWLLSSTILSSVNDYNDDAPKNNAAKAKTKINRDTKASVSTVPIQTNKNQQQLHHQTFATDVTFADRTDLHVHSKRAVTEIMGLTSMTEIQDRTFAAVTTHHKDVLGRARTGTGKTVAFLLPAIERILQIPNHHKNRIGILVVSPTRELATQIGDQAEKLLTFHRNMSVQVMFGGTNLKRDITRLSQQPQGLPTILVATPGRLLDHLQSTTLPNGQRFGADIMSQTPLVVLDETDRLLDMGFRRDIEKILKFLPPSTHRQTLLFSATIPKELKVIMAQNMKPDYIEVDCINDGDAATHTNEQVQQSHVIISNSDRYVSSVIEVVRFAIQKHNENDNDDNAKIVIFFPTARLVNFFAELFHQGNIIPGLPILELHSKKSQAYRNRVSEEFRNLKRGVLFTSDVSARGVDYPNVSHVIQFGMPESRDQYIHRLGRTGRAGTDGKGWLVLSEWESMFLQELKGVDIPVDEELREMLSTPIAPDAQEIVDGLKERVGNGDKILTKSASGAYQAFLGYYLGQMKRMKMKQKEDLVEIANEFALLSGLQEPPSIPKNLVGKMGLKGVAGLNVSGGLPHGRSSHYGHNDGRRAPRRNSGR